MAHVIAKSVASRLFRFFIVAFRYISKDHTIPKLLILKEQVHRKQYPIPWQILVCSSYVGMLVLCPGVIQWNL